MTKINLITSWNIECGIADTTRLLVDELKKYDDININICPVKKIGSRNPLYFFKLLKKIQKNQITHIQYHSELFGQFIPHFSLSYFPAVIFFLKFWRKNMIITTVHEVDPNSAVDKLIIKFLNLSDRIIAHNIRLINSMGENGIKKEKLSLVPLGSSKSKKRDKKWCKNKLGISKKTVLTIFGFVSPNKGHDLVIDILTELGEECILIIAGGTKNKEQIEYINSLKAKISTLQLENRVKFLDFVDEKELPIVACASDIFLYPYRWIVASAALNLALSYEIPTITSDIDYFKEIKNEYHCIELFKNDDRDDLLQKIYGLLESAEKQKYLQNKCRYFLKKTSWTAVGGKTRNLYLNLLD